MQLILTRYDKNKLNEVDRIFLGTWCLDFDIEPLNSNVNVVNYHWRDRGKFFCDYNYLCLIKQKYLKILSSKLNTIHSENKSDEYWNLVLGYWLNIFISIVFDRYTVIKDAFHCHDISSVQFVDFEKDELTPNDSVDFFKSMVSDDWNQHIFQSIIDFLGVKVEKKIHKKKNVINKEIFIESKDKFNVIKYFLKIFNHNILMNNKIYFSKTYLPKFANIVLQLSFNNLPNFSLKRKISEYNLDFHLRDKLHSASHENQSEFERLLDQLIKFQIPKSFIEGYKEIKLSNEYPKNPRLIFTSISHFIDDKFKIWAAEMRGNGIPLVTIDHGGFGMNLINESVNYQDQVSDYVFTWGKRNLNNKKFISTGIQKTIGKHTSHDKNGYCLLIEYGIPRYSYDLRSMVFGELFIDYLENQFIFYSSISDRVRNSFKLRLYPIDYGWNERAQWKKNFPEINIVNSSESIEESVEHSRICVVSYNATTYLELFAQNIPTIIFWDEGLWETGVNGQNHLKKLEFVGVFHKNPVSAAGFINFHWDKIEDWWLSIPVQEAVNAFLKDYAIKKSNPISVLRDSLNSCLVGN